MMMGLGSIVGTGVFVSIAIGTAIAGPYIIFAIGLAAIVAICNGLSSAQLAANYPVSGGTYEYGYRLLPNGIGFVAGWMFLLAKSASAATAALGLSGYLMANLDSTDNDLTVAVAMGVLVATTTIALAGIERTNRVNVAIVSFTLLTLMIFAAAGAPTAITNFDTNLSVLFSFREFSVPSLLHATALMFVAYTGYGRIATLGEEVNNPHRTIPRAIIITLGIAMLLYLSIAVVALGSVGAETFAAIGEDQMASLRRVADTFTSEEQGWGGLTGAIISLGAITAMLGVLINLLLGLSRVMLAMARRGDMPQLLSQISTHRSVPVNATIAVAAIIGTMVLIGDIELTWSFSAFAVLIYYAITNACALKLNAEQRIFPIWTAWIGLIACLGLCFWIQRDVLILGGVLTGLGLLWNRVIVTRNN